MLICRNVERVHGKKKAGNPCSSTIGQQVMTGQTEPLLWVEYMPSCSLFYSFPLETKMEEFRKRTKLIYDLQVFKHFDIILTIVGLAQRLIHRAKCPRKLKLISRFSYCIYLFTVFLSWL